MKLFLVFILFSTMTYSRTQVFEGVAKYEGKIVYFERQTLVYEQGGLARSKIEYIDPNGKIIGLLKSDYSHGLGVPEYIFHDYRHGILQGLNWKGPLVEMFSRERGEKVIHKMGVSKLRGETLITGPGLVPFIARHLHQIIDRKGLRFKLIIAGRLDAFDFVIKPLKQSGNKVEIEVRIKSWWLHIFTPRFRMTYQLPTRRLVSFEGLSNLRDEEGEMMSVDIQYHYP